MNYPRYKLLRILFSFFLVFPLYADEHVRALDTRRGIPGEIDFLEYWSAAKLFVAKQNPYDGEKLEVIQASVRSTERDVVIMWNPPWIFALTSILNFIPADIGVGLWFICSIVLFTYVLNQLFDLFDVTSRSQKRWLYALSITFPPLLSNLDYGQLSIVLLFGWTLLLKSMLSKNLLKGGVGFYITLLKPHLLYVPYLFLLMKRRFAELMVGSIITMIALVVVCLWNPSVVSNYFSAIKAPPINWRTPTIGTLLQEYGEGFSEIVLRTIPHVFGIVLLLVIVKRYSSKSNTALLLASVPVSLLFNSYGWIYDQLLLLPTVIWSIKILTPQFKRGFCVPLYFFIVHFCYLMSAPRQEYGIWYTALVLVVSLRALHLLDEKNNESTIALTTSSSLIH